MFKFITVGSVAAFAQANSIVNQEMVDAIRSANALWVPAEVSENKFANYTDQEIKNLLGTVINHGNFGSEDIPRHETTQAPKESFDWR